VESLLRRIRQVWHERVPRSGVFISYAHDDDVKWLKGLLAKLQPLTNSHGIRVWTDREIAPGDNWHLDIQNALDRAKVGVMLISPKFLDSPLPSPAPPRPDRIGSGARQTPPCWRREVAFVLIRPLHRSIDGGGLSGLACRSPGLARSTREEAADVHCGSGFWGGQRPSLADYVAGPEPRGAADAAGGGGDRRRRRLVLAILFPIVAISH
jgi:hypothetical protein